MQLFTIFAFVSLSLVIASYKDRDYQVDQYDSAELEAVSDNLIVYHNYVSNYAKQNPAATGVVSDLSLDLPVWYKKIEGIENYVAGGRSYTYISDMPGLSALLGKKTQSISVGFKREGILYSVTQGNTSIAIPSQVPEGAVVYFQ